MPIIKKLLIAIPIVFGCLFVFAVIAFFLIDDKTIEENALDWRINLWFSTGIRMTSAQSKANQMKEDYWSIILMSNSHRD